MSWVAYFVIGTLSPAAMIFTPGLAMSFGDAIPAGSSLGVMITRWLPANGVTSPLANPPPTSFLGFVVSADRKTSAGAPCSIFVSRADDESVETVRVVPAWAA